MFYYGHEWYWGIDRLHYLEKRLAELGADTQTHQSLLMPRPEIPAANLVDNGSLTLEFYPSLRSPYTAIVFEKVVEFCQKCLNIALEVGDRAGEGGAYGNLGCVYDRLGQFEKAVEFHQKRLNIVLEVGDRAGQGTACH